ncbi:MAG: class I SAM-dependent methyltransferase [Geminicoccaceae bacterium]
MNLGAATRTCPVCEARDLARQHDDVEDFEYRVPTERSFSILRCRACGSDHLDPRPSVSEIASFYPADYHAYHDDHSGLARLLVRLRSRSRARFYQRLIPGGSGRLFDVGTGDCRHFDALKPHCKLDFAGVEIKPEIAEKARVRGYDVETGTLETMDIERHVGRYDIISMNHVIEHVLDPREMVRRSFALLKPGGYAIGQNPARDCWEEKIAGRYWAGYHFPRHLQAFTYRGMEGILQQAGFTDVEVTTAPHVQAALSLQNRLVGSNRSPRMRYGKMPFYSWLILAALPFETIAWLAGKGGVLNFSARKPL